MLQRTFDYKLPYLRRQFRLPPRGLRPSTAPSICAKWSEFSVEDVGSSSARSRCWSAWRQLCSCRDASLYRDFTILIDPRPSHVADNNDQPQASNFGTDDAMVESQVLLIQSNAVLRGVVENLNLADDPEFGPHSGFLDPILSLFSMPAHPERPSETRCQSQDRRMPSAAVESYARGTTFVIDIDAALKARKRRQKSRMLIGGLVFLRADPKQIQH